MDQLAPRLDRSQGGHQPIEVSQSAELERRDLLQQARERELAPGNSITHRPGVSTLVEECRPWNRLKGVMESLTHRDDVPPQRLVPPGQPPPGAPPIDRDGAVMPTTRTRYPKAGFWKGVEQRCLPTVFFGKQLGWFEDHPVSQPGPSPTTGEPGYRA